MPNTRSAGFSLIEVLIAMLILAVGLIGMLGVTVGSMQLSSSSNYRSVAAQHTYAMAEVLRANPITLGAANAEETVFSAAQPVPKATCIAEAGCDRDAYVGNTFFMWQKTVQVTLPSGAGTVCRDSGPAIHVPTATSATVNWNCDGNGQYVVKVCWSEARIALSSAKAAEAGYGGAGGLVCTWTGI